MERNDPARQAHLTPPSSDVAHPLIAAHAVPLTGVQAEPSLDSRGRALVNLEVDQATGQTLTALTRCGSTTSSSVLSESVAIASDDVRQRRPKRFRSFLAACLETSTCFPSSVIAT